MLSFLSDMFCHHFPEARRESFIAARKSLEDQLLGVGGTFVWLGYTISTEMLKC